VDRRLNYNELQFWILFLAVIAPYWFLPHRGQNALLLVASYVFYGFWDYRFLFLILLTTIVDYIGGLGVAGGRLGRRRQAQLATLLVVAAILLTGNVHYTALAAGLVAGDLSAMLAALPRSPGELWIPAATAAVFGGYMLLLPRLYRMPEARRRKVFLVISITANLAVLGFFKYFDFFVASLADLLAAFGIEASRPLLAVVLPAGISFYTFQAMSYTIDIYRGKCEPTRNFWDFALFVCFFPHLVAGPIMRAHTLLPQVVRERLPSSAQFREGLALVLVGLFKKLVLADNMAPIANYVFVRLGEGDTAGMSGSEVLVGIYAFAFQIYGDFSGYSSIARGISKWLGFELMINFHNPYLAVTPRDFWRRWHISLSSWLRDYLYIPLGGNRHGRLVEYRSLLITMLLGGLWHGASWTFVAWGLYHGLILCAYRFAGVREADRSSEPALWAMQAFVMFHLTCLGWLLFRADNFGAVSSALHVLVGQWSFSPVAGTGFLLIVFYAALLFAVEWLTDGENRMQRLFRVPWPVQGAWYLYLVLMIAFFYARESNEFIYFQF
jgi:D-alanyl-lipoteichoic acid acyltransferase DltB (MBOAT superfamily)